MAIKDFKKIEDRKGYLVDDDDRQIFEKEIGKAPFGMGLSDMIEFILYDANDNQLPQGERGELVRYIHLSDKESKKYFTITNSQYTKKTNGAPEIIFDLEELIRDAGYGNGVFKTQITLLNRRVGTEEVQTDKLWIQEISPSRTEIRVLPIKNTDTPSEDLLKRYEIFTKQGNFRDDTIYYAVQYIENLDVNQIFQIFLREKGKLVDGIKYDTLIKKEFKVENLTTFFTQIKENLVESISNFINGNYYLKSDNRFGTKIQGYEILELSIADIDRIIEESLQDIIEYYLPKRNILEKTELTPEQQQTLDDVKNILKTSTKNSLYESTIPDTINLPIRGCTDPDAKNFNPNAEEDNGTCQYIDDTPIDVEIYGCTDSTALNYNKFATIDDNSCRYEKEEGGGTGSGGGGSETKKDIIIGPKTYYIWSDRGSISYLPPNATDLRIINGVEYDSFQNINFVKGNIKFEGDVREVPKPQKPLVIRAYKVKNLNAGQFSFKYKDKSGKPAQSSVLSTGETIVVCAVKDSIEGQRAVNAWGGLKVIDVGTCPYTPAPIKGCTSPKATNYNPKATQDDGSCKFPPDDIVGCMDTNALNYNPLATKSDNSCEYPSPVTGCTDPRAKNYNPLATRNIPDDCIYDVKGCMNPIAQNYNPNATIDDGTCILPRKKVKGCTDKGALNFNAMATHDDGSCQYKKPKVGCTDRAATNYDPSAEINSGCKYNIVVGCRDPKAINYNPQATISNNSLCKYQRLDDVRILGCTDPQAINYAADATKDDGSCRYAEVIDPNPRPRGGGGGGNRGGTSEGTTDPFGGTVGGSGGGSYINKPKPKDAMK